MPQHNLAVVLRPSHRPMTNKSAEAKITTVVVIWNNHFHEFMFRETHQWAQGQRVQPGLEWKWRGAPGGKSWRSSTVFECPDLPSEHVLSQAAVGEVLRSFTSIKVLLQHYKYTTLQASLNASDIYLQEYHKQNVLQKHLRYKNKGPCGLYIVIWHHKYWSVNVQAEAFSCSCLTWCQFKLHHEQGRSLIPT